jgi:hypothetical protein
MAISFAQAFGSTSNDGSLANYHGCWHFHALMNGKVDPDITMEAIGSAAMFLGFAMASDWSGTRQMATVLNHLVRSRSKLDHALSTRNDEAIAEYLEICLNGLCSFHIIRLNHQDLHLNHIALKPLKPFNPAK